MIFHGLLASLDGSNFKLRFLVIITYLITCSNSQKAAGFAASFTFDSSHVTLEILDLEVLQDTVIS